jgi:nitrate/TMAO reductase-like tetraheme cytochrome c subunit
MTLGSKYQTHSIEKMIKDDTLNRMIQHQMEKKLAQEAKQAEEVANHKTKLISENQKLVKKQAEQSQQMRHKEKMD